MAPLLLLIDDGEVTLANFTPLCRLDDLSLVGRNSIRGSLVNINMSCTSDVRAGFQIPRRDGRKSFCCLLQKVVLKLVKCFLLNENSPDPPPTGVVRWDTGTNKVISLAQLCSQTL